MSGDKKKISGVLDDAKKVLDELENQKPRKKKSGQFSHKTQKEIEQILQEKKLPRKKKNNNVRESLDWAEYALESKHDTERTRDTVGKIIVKKHREALSKKERDERHLEISSWFKYKSPKDMEEKYPEARVKAAANPTIFSILKKKVEPLTMYEPEFTLDDGNITEERNERKKSVEKIGMPKELQVIYKAELDKYETVNRNNDEQTYKESEEYQTTKKHFTESEFFQLRMFDIAYDVRRKWRKLVQESHAMVNEMFPPEKFTYAYFGSFLGFMMNPNPDGYNTLPGDCDMDGDITQFGSFFLQLRKQVKQNPNVIHPKLTTTSK